MEGPLEFSGSDECIYPSWILKETTANKYNWRRLYHHFGIFNDLRNNPELIKVPLFFKVASLSFVYTLDYVYIRGTNGLPLSAKFYLEFFTTFTLIYSPSAVILFYTLCKAASQNLDQMKQEIKELAASRPTGLTKQRVNQIKEYYFRNVKFINKISQHFGAILLLEISNSFFGIMVQMANTVLGLGNQEPWSHHLNSFCFCCLYTINIISSISVSENISNKVIPNWIIIKLPQ